MYVPSWFVIVSAALFGFVFGSFGNVCIYRLPRRCLSIVRPRSRCPGCGREIAWFDNVPVLSYLALGGRCRGCAAPISLRYPLVESACALLFAITAFSLVRADFGITDLIARGPVLAVYLLIAWVLLVASVIDLDFRIIPDELTKPGMWLGPFISALFPALHSGDLPLWPAAIPGLRALSAPWAIHVQGFAAGLTGLAVGAGLVYGVGVVGKVIFRKEAMGFGDVKYMGMLGALLGWKLILVVFFLGCLYGSVVGIGIFLITKSHYLAFGPYLSLGALTVIWLREALLPWVREFAAVLWAILTMRPF
ncbi:MAG: prepilin peptidase [Planctomycetes bacterium]|nr:prepilin peptidase [Planctomycetota bacterium]